MTPPEAAWRILRFCLHKNSHVVYRLQIHLPGTKPLQVKSSNEQDSDGNDDGVDPDVDTTADRRTMLTGWFELNASDLNARQYLYVDIPLHYVWQRVKNNNSRWTPRKRLNKMVIGRMYNVSPKRREVFHMRLLLLHVKGPRSFEELRTVDGTLYPTFEEACRAMNLLADDQEWFKCMEEAVRKDMPSVLRRLFAYILIFCEVGSPQALWNKFKTHLMEDYIRRWKLGPQEAERRTLLKIRRILEVHCLSITQFGFIEPEGIDSESDDDVAADRLCQDGDEMVSRLNSDQRKVFDRIMHAIETESSDPLADRLFHVRGAAGTGKTFLYNTLLTVLEGQGKITIAMAWSGLAASLLRGGRTVHSQFQLPIPLLSDSKSGLSAYSKEGVRMRGAKFLLWDEISMATATAFDLIDRTLRQLCRNNRPFGGKTVVIGGDFKQCLPIVEAGDRVLTLKACVKEALIWKHFLRLTLNTNKRVNRDEDAASFLEWLERLGNGTLPAHNNKNGCVEIPSQCLTDSLDSLIKEIFFQNDKEFDAVSVANNAILTPLNVSCNEINKMVLDKVPGQTTTYYSVDSVEANKGGDNDEVEAINYPMEFLNKLTPTDIRHIVSNSK